MKLAHGFQAAEKLIKININQQTGATVENKVRPHILQAQPPFLCHCNTELVRESKPVPILIIPVKFPLTNFTCPLPER